MVQVIGEGQEAADKFEQHNAERPEVRDRAVPFATHDLGRHVMRGADDRKGAALVLGELFGNAKVDELHVPAVVQHDVLGLQIPVQDAAVVQRLDGDEQRPRVELRLRTRQDSRNAANGGVQITSRDELGEHADPTGQLERPDQFKDERVVVLQEDGDLIPHLRWRRAILLLSHRLQRVADLAPPVLNKMHRAEGARADRTHMPQVLQ
mmetsp:Transcript_91655/g.280456  ORF Transcript_91655/g.280456 Transcript_91655/m.280456 type:complete len:208 (+) Transcript_91655:411-1034(+)